MTSPRVQGGAFAMAKPFDDHEDDIRASGREVTSGPGRPVVVLGAMDRQRQPRALVGVGPYPDKLRAWMPRMSVATPAPA